MWGHIAQELLDAAVGSGVEVERAIVAPGPQWARDCQMLAVHMERVPVVDPVPRGGRGPSLGMCAWVAHPHFVVTYVGDCVPISDDFGSAPPPANEITAWATEFLANGDRVWQALSELAEEGIAGFDCEAIRIGETLPAGPEGRIAQIQIPVAVLQTAVIPEMS